MSTSWWTYIWGMNWPPSCLPGSQPPCWFSMSMVSSDVHLACQGSSHQLSECLELSLSPPDPEAAIASGPPSPTRPASACWKHACSPPEAEFCSAALYSDSEEILPRSGWSGGRGSMWCGWRLAGTCLLSACGCFGLAVELSFLLRQTVVSPKDMASLLHCATLVQISFCDYRKWNLVKFSLFEAKALCGKYTWRHWKDPWHNCCITFYMQKMKHNMWLLQHTLPQCVRFLLSFHHLHVSVSECFGGWSWQMPLVNM